MVKITRYKGTKIKRKNIKIERRERIKRVKKMGKRKGRKRSSRIKNKGWRSKIQETWKKSCIRVKRRIAK